MNTILSMVLFPCMVFGQVTIPKLENTSVDTVFTNDSSIRSLRNQNDLVIMYRRVNYTIKNGREIADFNVISLKPGGKWKYHLLNQKKNKKTFTPLKASQDSIKKIYQAFVDNDIFSLKTKDQIKDSCEVPLLMGGANYEFIIMTKDQYKILSYPVHQPRKRECPEFQKIWNCAKAVLPFKRIS